MNKKIAFCLIISLLMILVLASCENYEPITGKTAVTQTPTSAAPSKGSETPLPTGDSTDTATANPTSSVTASHTPDPTLSLTPDPTPTPTPEPTPKPTPTPTPTPLPIDEDGDYILKKTEDGGLDYQNRIIFLGDSTSYGLKPYKMLPGGKETEQVWYGSVGATIALFNVKTVKLTATNFADPITISKALETYKPDILVLKLGINGIKTLDEKAFKEYYGWVINEVYKKSPDTKLICQAIYPVKSDNDVKITKTHVLKANLWIKDLVKEKYNDGYKCYYLDSYDIFLGSDGYLDPKYENGGDGIHFNEKGYKLALEYIRTHMIPD